ncbi:ShlB/FhaC/HecB family hemolysin secretion/activation protein [Utexia brackfieldae]|uniref:ShlB/FhaC/HecB family hemolysin secretion/activation protein n=1 Tax=Utexia brackfieldae TaxID=3074108 RepID=UPI00370D6F98
MMTPRIIRKTCVALISLSATGTAVGAEGLANLNQISDQQLIYQQERQKALAAQLTPQTRDVRLLPTIKGARLLDFPQESPCFIINKVNLLRRDALSYIMPLYALSRQAEGRCLGAQGINLLMSALQNRLISYGYITSRVVAPPQDLTRGELSLLFVPGKIRQVYYDQTSDPQAKLSTGMPAKPGQILNLRDIEQGLENLQRMPTVTANMQLVPGQQPGESDIVIHREQVKRWRLGVSLDDSGTRSTGRYQGGMTLYLDNPLLLSDTLYISGGHDLDRNSEFGSKNYLVGYSVPFRYWLLSLSFGGNDYYQQVAGAFTDYQYSGRSENQNFQLSRVIHRNESQKTTLYYGINLRESHNFVDHTEVDIQQRRTTSWRLGVQHRHYIQAMTLDLDVSYQKGVRWFGALQAPEELAHEGTALSEIFKLNASLSVPFTLATQRFRYDINYQGQLARHGHLTPQERFSIGGRWTVRGFDGELSLSADNGWFVRNELSWATPYAQELYLGLDYGEVSGADSGYLLGKKLAGSALGLRGDVLHTNYDLFIGAPIYKPKGFRTNDTVLGFNLNWHF